MLVYAFISIRTSNICNPMLLYLHGGAGKSYYPFSDTKNISIDTFLDDIYELTIMILNRFKKERLFLVDHSWVSVLGLKFAQLYSNLLNAYICCSQVVNMKKISKIYHDFFMQHASNKIVNKLKNIDWTYNQENWFNDLFFVTNQGPI